MPGSGRTALEAGALSVIEPGDRVLVIGAGVFGVLMREIMGRVGADVTEFPVEWGARLDLERLAARGRARCGPRPSRSCTTRPRPAPPIPPPRSARSRARVGALFLLDTVSSIAGLDVRTDEWGVDLNMTGSQKCLAAPLGMALVSVSPRAWEAMEQRKEQPAHPTSTTCCAGRSSGSRSRAAARCPTARRGGSRSRSPRTSPRAMRVAVAPHPRGGPAAPLPPPRGGRRRPARGRAPRWGSRCSRIHGRSRTRCRRIKTPKGIDTGAVVARDARPYGDPHRHRPRQDPHDARCASAPWAITASPHYVLPTLSALELALRDLGYKAEPGAGVAAAQPIFADAA